jgi:hypothetical protein
MTEIIFMTSDSSFTRIYDKFEPRSHKWYFLKDDSRHMWTETKYNGDACFGGKNFFELLAEMNMSKSRLDKANCTPTEMGMKLYRGTTKLIKKSKGQIINLELKYPEILIDDEHSWKNRKPKIVTEIADDDDDDDDDDECECDCCLRYSIPVSCELDMVLDELTEKYPPYAAHRAAKK